MMGPLLVVGEDVLLRVGEWLLEAMTQVEAALGLAMTMRCGHQAQTTFSSGLLLFLHTPHDCARRNYLHYTIMLSFLCASQRRDVMEW
jgi:hypothetical protein